LKVSRSCILTALLSVSMPLLFILMAITFSTWFNVYDNALSDLGHAMRSSVAPIFNAGLSLGAFLLVVFAVGYVKNVSKALAILIALCAFSLNLVAVFDEVYGSLHYWVSVAFFTLVAFLLVGCGYVMKRMSLAMLALAVGIAVWYIHITHKVPRGAAIPELISVFISIPFLITFAYRNVCRV